MKANKILHFTNRSRVQKEHDSSLDEDLKESLRRLHANTATYEDLVFLQHHGYVRITNTRRNSYTFTEIGYEAFLKHA